MQWYKHYPGDYITATLRLSMVEDGAYRRLMDEYYSTEMPLPLDLDECCRIARAYTEPERAAVRRVVPLFFDECADGWRMARIDEEIEKANRQAATNRRIAAERVARQTANESSHGSLNESSHEGGNEKGTNPDSRLQTPDSKTAEGATRPSGKPAAAKRGTRLDAWLEKDSSTARAEQWRAMKSWCEDHRPDLDPKATFERFHDHWVAQPGQRGVKMDWMATWRNWCRNEKIGPKATPEQRQQNRDAATVAWELVTSFIGKVPRDKYPEELKAADPKAFEALFKAGSWMELCSMNPNQQKFEFKPRFMEAYHAL